MEAEWEGLNESDYFLIRTKVDHRILVVMITFFLRKFSLRGKKAFRFRNVKPSARHKFGAGEEQFSDAQFAKNPKLHHPFKFRRPSLRGAIVR